MWILEKDAPRALLQGLIQVAAAFHKSLVQLQPGGCVRLLTMALEKLAPLGASSGGVDVATVRAGAEQALGLAVAWNAGQGSPPGRADAPVIRAG